MNLGKVLIKNSNQEGGLNKTYLFESSKAVVQGSTFTQEHDHTLGFKVGYSVEFEGGIPIAKAKTSVSTELSYQYTNRQSTQKSDREDFILKWNEGGVLPPQHAAHCTAFAMTGKFDDDYTATMRLELASGQKFDIKQTGRFESIGWTEAQSDCKILSLKEAEGLGPIEEREGESTENETESQRRAVPIHFSA